MPVVASYPSLRNSTDWLREACGRNSLFLLVSKIRDRAPSHGEVGSFSLAMLHSRSICFLRGRSQSASYPLGQLASDSASFHGWRICWNGKPVGGPQHNARVDVGQPFS